MFVRGWSYLEPYDAQRLFKRLKLLRVVDACY